MGGRVYAKMNGIHLRVIIAHRKETRRSPGPFYAHTNPDIKIQV